jgi:hypothetical protein
LFSCKYLLYSCLEPFFRNVVFFCQTAAIIILCCVRIFLSLLFVFLANCNISFVWAPSLHLLYFARYLMFLNHLGKSLRKKGRCM